MKKHRNNTNINCNVLNITTVLVILSILTMFLTRFVNVSYAYPTELPNKLTSSMGDIISDRVSLFDDLYDDEVIALVPYYASDGSNKYTVYCLEKEKGWGNGLEITKSNEKLDKGYIYLVQNGYPSKSLTGDNSKDNYLTQIAVWLYQDRSNGVSDSANGILSSNQKNVILNSSYGSIIDNLVTGAIDAKNNSVVINPTFSISSSNFKLSSDKSYLVTDLISVSSNVSFDSYNVSVDSSAVDILDENGAVVTSSINSDKKFKLRVKLADIDSPISVNVSVVVNYSEYEAYSYLPPDDMKDDMQKALAAVIVSCDKQKTVSKSVTMPTGSLTIRKKDASTNTSLAGARLEVRRSVNNQVVASFTTTTSDYVINNLIPGEYKIKEIAAPSGYYFESATSNVLIDTTNLDVRREIENIPYEVLIRKVDADSGNVISGAILVVSDDSGVEVARVTTSSDYLSIPNLSAGTYSVREVKAPDGYTLSSDVKTFTINSDNPRVSIDFSNSKNKTLIEKKDASSLEFVSGAKLRLINSSGDIIDEWISTNKAHAVYGLLPDTYKVIEIAAPSGYTLSSSEVSFTITNNQEDVQTITFYNSKNQVEISKVDSETNNLVSGAQLEVVDSLGNVIDNFVTTDSPKTLSKLAPGTYSVREVKAPDGYTLSSEVYKFEVDSNSSNIVVQIKNTKNEVRLLKVDKDSNIAIAGAKLKLTDSSGNVVDEFTSSNDDYVIRGLKKGIYYLEEVKAPLGYIRNKEKFKIEIKDTDGIVSYSISNQKIKASVLKVDGDTNDPISGVILELLDSKKDVISTFTTGSDAYILDNLSEGTYYVREIKNKDGYVLDNSLHKFVIDSNNYNVKVVIKNKPITVSLSKSDISSGRLISGAILELNREDGMMNPITFVSMDTPYIVKGLVPGIYSLKEVKAPDGYVGTSAKTVFEVKDNGEVQNVNLTSDYINIKISDRKLMIDTKRVAGYKFKLKRKDGSEVATITVDEDLYVSDHLELGDYILTMEEVPDGVIKNDLPYYFRVKEEERITSVNLLNGFTKVMISKKDMANSAEVKGAHLQVLDSNGNVIDEWISGSDTHYIQKLPVGSYSLKEVIAPDGYVLNSAIINFEVTETLDIQSVTMFNSKLVDVPNTGIKSIYMYLVGGILIVLGSLIMYLSYKKKSELKLR